MNASRQPIQTDWQDRDDAPDLSTATWQEKFAAADVREGDKVISRGRGRPPAVKPKEHINIRLSPDVVAAFRATGAGWQTRIDAVLREWLETHEKI
ncbi:MAG: BrnA antitoxin family protein [Pseudochelatococcus sp.]|jgi:uncharacterized protein (DUF4415 family)|uniref:BrnA antitoxin family protein n=1 Tax=Pseudochelatococcus sp. TaxID=2020869 RepID=UPI003D8B384B